MEKKVKVGDKVIRVFKHETEPREVLSIFAAGACKKYNLTGGVFINDADQMLEKGQIELVEPTPLDDILPRDPEPTSFHTTEFTHDSEDGEDAGSLARV